MLRANKQKRRTVLITGRISEMARSEMVEAVGSELLDEIKRSDPHPQLVAMSVGHEGISTGQVVGHGPVEKVWSDEAIEQLARQVEGAGVYLNHQPDGSDRVPQGRVIKGLAKRLGSRLHAVAIAHVTNPLTRRRIADGVLDACSIEADCVFARSCDRRWVVKAIEKVTGVALASARFFKTGFRHAGVLAAVQEFEQEAAPTVEEVQEAVRELNLTPDKVFEPKQILSMPFVRDAIENELESRKNEMTGELRRAHEKMAAMEEELAAVRERNARVRMMRLVEDSPHLKDAERPLVQFLKDTLPIPSKEAPDQAAVNRLVEQELDRIRRYGITFSGVNGPKDGEAPAPPDSGRYADYTSPNNNDLIPR